MTRKVQVRSIGHRRLALPEDGRWVDEIGWIPVGATEVHLACRYYPLAVRFDGPTPVLGLVFDQRYLTRPLPDSSGAWRGTYKPLAVRCFPFSVGGLTDDPLTDIVIDADSKYLSDTEGILILDETGQPGRLLLEFHRFFRLLQDTRERFADALDQYLIADLLTPITGPEDEMPLYVLDPVRFLRQGPAALGAMARHNFLSVDLAVACLFSLQNMQTDRRPKSSAKVQELLASASIIPDVSIGDLSLALDDGDLISLYDIDALRSETV